MQYTRWKTILRPREMGPEQDGKRNMRLLMAHQWWNVMCTHKLWVTMLPLSWWKMELFFLAIFTIPKSIIIWISREKEWKEENRKEIPCKYLAFLYAKKETNERKTKICFFVRYYINFMAHSNVINVPFGLESERKIWMNANSLWNIEMNISKVGTVVAPAAAEAA